MEEVDPREALMGLFSSSGQSIHAQQPLGDSAEKAENEQVKNESRSRSKPKRMPGPKKSRNRKKLLKILSLLERIKAESANPKVQVYTDLIAVELKELADDNDLI